MNVLGKGCVGIVIAARLDSQIVALKIRRTDANRTTMKQEANMLRIANSVDVGPRLLGTSQNFLLMELLEGELIEEWFAQPDLKLDLDTVRGVLRDLLEQCHRLDSIGLDHGELSQARKHVLISGKRPRILDFETASTNRKPSNLSSLCQYLLIAGSVAQKTKKILGEINLNELKKSLTTYKQRKDADSYKGVLHAVHLL